jgi:hypothetical protein
LLALCEQLREMAPFFKFSTRERKDQKKGEVIDNDSWQQWDGVIADYEPADGPAAAVQDDTGGEVQTLTRNDVGRVPASVVAPRRPTATPPGPGQRPTNPTPTQQRPGAGPRPGAAVAPSTHAARGNGKSGTAPAPTHVARPGAKAGPAPTTRVAPTPAPTPPPADLEFGDLDSLGAAADAGDEDAQDRLTEAATAAGLTPEDVEGAPSWADLATQIKESGGGGEAEGVETATAEDGDAATGEWVPQPEQMYHYFPIDPRTKKPSPKPVSVEVLDVDEEARTCTLKNMVTQQEIKGVPWEKLEDSAQGAG